MKINGMVVCVKYADFFEFSIDRWAADLDNLIVVTDLQDNYTVALVNRVRNRHPGKISLHCTNVFYENGAKFNKGAAIEEARRAMPEQLWADWFLFFDADIVPPAGWKAAIEAAQPQPGKLYGAVRHQCDGWNFNHREFSSFPKIPDALCDGGYFQMFHVSDPSANAGRQDEPLIETCWAHAGVYDSHFKKRWPVEARALLPIRLLHLGERENWTGRGDKDGMRELLHNRAVKGGYQHERIQ